MKAPDSDTHSIYDTMIEFFEQDDWKYQELAQGRFVELGFRGDSGTWRCYAQAREEQAQFVFYSVLTVNVPPDRRQAVAEFLTRANYGLSIGNFEMDYGDGEVRYKTSIDVEGDRLTPALVKNLVYVNVLTMDDYFSGIMRVIFGGASPAEVIAEIEGSADDA